MTGAPPDFRTRNIERVDVINLTRRSASKPYRLGCPNSAPIVFFLEKSPQLREIRLQHKRGVAEVTLLTTLLFWYTHGMTIQQTIEIPEGLRRLDLPLQKECHSGGIELHISPAMSDEEAELELLFQEKPPTEAESAAHTQYLLRELAKAEQDVANGTRWLTMEEFFADDDEDDDP
jgi:hypothetical protein